MAKISFAKDIVAQTTTVTAITSPTTRIHVASNASFNVNDYAYIKESDGTEHTYLGKITAKGNDGQPYIDVTYSVSNKAIGAIVWKPTNHMEFEENDIFPVTEKIITNQITDYTSGGDIWAVQRAPNRTQFPLIFSAIGETDRDNLEDWFNNKAQGAYCNFYFSNKDKEVYEVRWLDKEFKMLQTGNGIYDIDILLEVVA